MTENYRGYRYQEDRENRRSGRNGGMRRKMAATGFTYLFFTLFVLLFGAIYEYFSFGVYSGYMLYAFVFPLIGGVLVYFGLAYTDIRIPDEIARKLYNFAIAVWTVGSLFQGILDIYGTTNALTMVYWIGGALLMAAAVIRYSFFSGSRDI